MTNISFWDGFVKRAEAYVSAPGASAGSAERALLWNEQGGVNPRSPEDLQGALNAHLVTLPQDVEGASCASCSHFRQLDADLGAGFCTNPQLKQDVTARMVCSLWENPGSHSGAEEQLAAQQQETSMATNIMQDFSQPGQEQGGMAPAPEEQQQQVAGDPAAGAAPPAGEAPAPAATPPAGEAPAPAATPKHTINVNVGEKKTASVARIGQILGRLGKMKGKNYHTTSSSFRTRKR